jgi:uncharacterized protein
MPTQIRDLVEQTPMVDTHEHLLEESERLGGKAGERLFPCNDWAYLFMHYLHDDLAGAGMSDDALRRFLAPDTSTEEKYRLVAPYWERTKHTGYAQAVRYTLRGLYGEDDLTAESAPRLAEKYLALLRPGFYREILREKSNLESCQVNALERIFRETEQPDLLHQDIGFPTLSSDLDLERVKQETGQSADSLDGYLAIVDDLFARCASRAVAAKNQSAYSRRLNYDNVPKEQAEPLFARHAKGETLASDEKKALQDHLFRYCVGKATEHGLPVKLHTGYYAGRRSMPLERLRQNAGDLCPLLKDFPETKFVLMHIGYPYQDEFIALAKHYPNAYIDMCWAWIINPAASVRFLKEFLLAAPASKLFPFGGDYVSVECVYGHSRIARQGITQALSELVAEGWIAQKETPALIERILRGNAHAVFPQPR